jgi:hypothetical protein
MENTGSFCDSTRVLKTSIIGMPVRTMRRGMMRLAGFTDGPPRSIMFSVISGPRSRGTPLPVKIRPSSASEKGTCIGRPRNRTLASVEMPRLPAKTWRSTRPPSRRMTCASDTPWREVTSASSR